MAFNGSNGETNSEATDEGLADADAFQTLELRDVVKTGNWIVVKKMPNWTDYQRKRMLNGERPGTWRDGHMSYHSLVADPPFPLVLAADFGMLLIHLSLGLRPSVPVLCRYSSSSVCHAFPP